jgi:hypothetical protein
MEQAKMTGIKPGTYVKCVFVDGDKIEVFKGKFLSENDFFIRIEGDINIKFIGKNCITQLISPSCQRQQLGGAQ